MENNDLLYFSTPYELISQIRPIPTNPQLSKGFI